MTDEEADTQMQSGYVTDCMSIADIADLLSIVNRLNSAATFSPEVTISSFTPTAYAQIIITITSIYKLYILLLYFNYLHIIRIE